MSILGKYTNLTDKEETSFGYIMPTMLKEDKDELPFKNAVIISTILHPLTLGLIWLFIAILTLLGINLVLFEKPKPKMNDIEFVLVDKEGIPKDKNTKYRSAINSRTGGKNDPKKLVSMPSSPKQAAAPAAPTAASKKNVQQPVKQPQTVKQPVQQATKPQQVQSKPQPPTARPSIKPPSTPKAIPKPTSAFKIPVPSGGQKSGSYSTGPISGSGTAAKSGGSYAPTPSLAPTGGSSAGTRLATGGGGTGNIGNPGGGGGAPGIDAIREPDFGPYMRDLQRRIKMNWDPPKGNESKRVVLLFKIAKDGRLLSCRVFKSSGLQSADNAALNAVKLTAPFRPLPADFRGSDIDIQFTFDYNVFGAAQF